MPRNTREVLLRKVDQALNDIDRALENLQAVHGTYQPTHEGHAKFIEVVSQQLVMSQGLLTDFKEKHM